MLKVVLIVYNVTYCSAFHIKMNDEEIKNHLFGSDFFMRGFLGVRNERLKETALLNGGNLHQMILTSTLLKLVEKGR